MIAVSSSGKNFGAIARYLALGRTGDAPERVAWASARNVPTADPELAARFMRATAAQNVAIEKPVYHLVIAFDPRDPVDPATMERVADRVLTRLGLAEHEVIIVAHRDREHPHMHLLVNRVHPTTGLAWDRWQDRAAIQEVLREEELSLGIRRVRGSFTAEREYESALAPAARERRAVTQPADSFTARVRERVPDCRQCATWAELERELATAGLRLERSGQGLVVTDGTLRVKASKVSRELGMGQLGKRFGMPYDLYHARGNEQVPLPLAVAERRTDDPRGQLAAPPLFGAGPVPHTTSLLPTSVRPDVARVGELLATYERIDSLAQEQFAAAAAHRAAQARLGQFDAAERRLRQAIDALERTSAIVYRDPSVALVAIDEMIRSHGLVVTIRLVRESPERFGTLQRERLPRPLGLGHTERDDAARRAAPGLATQLQELWNARERHTVTRDRSSAERDLKRSDAHRRDLFRALSQLPGREQLEREIGRLMNRFVPQEIEELQRLATTPRLAVALRIRDAVKDIALGREGEQHA